MTSNELTDLAECMCLGVEQGPNTGLESPAHFLPDVQKLKRERITNALAVDSLILSVLSSIQLPPCWSVLFLTANSFPLGIGAVRLLCSGLLVHPMTCITAELTLLCDIRMQMVGYPGNQLQSEQSKPIPDLTLSDATDSCPSRQGMPDPTMQTNQYK
jgi:hypothetical protein